MATKGAIVAVDGNTYANVPIDASVYNYFSASGANQDRWYVEAYADYTRIQDDAEPQVVAVAPMAGGISRWAMRLRYR